MIAATNASLVVTISAASGSSPIGACARALESGKYPTGLANSTDQVGRYYLDACRRTHERNRKAFRSATLYEAAHILFADRRDRPMAFGEARAAADAVLAEVAQAPLHSACPSASQGGNLGQISAGPAPCISNARSATPPGRVPHDLTRVSSRGGVADKSGSGGRDRTGDLRIMIPPL